MGVLLGELPVAVRPLEVLIGCEESGVVRDAFIALGHRAMSCDLLPTRRAGPHYEGSVFDVIDYPWDLAIFHPPCTHTSVSGAKWFADKWADGRQAAGGRRFVFYVVGKAGGAHPEDGVRAAGECAVAAVQEAGPDHPAVAVWSW